MEDGKIETSSVLFVYPSSDAPGDIPIFGVLFSAKEVNINGDNGYMFQVEGEMGPEDAREAYNDMPKGHMGLLVSRSGLSRMIIHTDLKLFAGPLLGFLETIEKQVLPKLKIVPLSVNSKGPRS